MSKNQRRSKLFTPAPSEFAPAFAPITPLLFRDNCHRYFQAKGELIRFDFFAPLLLSLKREQNWELLSIEKNLVKMYPPMTVNFQLSCPPINAVLRRYSLCLMLIGVQVYGISEASFSSSVLFIWILSGTMSEVCADPNEEDSEVISSQ